MSKNSPAKTAGPESIIACNLSMLCGGGGEKVGGNRFVVH